MDKFSYFSLKPYVVTPHLNRLETVQIRGHNICFYAELTKIIPNYHQILSRALFFDFLFASMHNVALPKWAGLQIRSIKFRYSFLKTYVVTPHKNCLAETALMRGHTTCFH